MSHSIRSYIVGVVLILITFEIIAQADDNYKSGYIILQNGDSLSGFISIGSHYENTQRCHFKRSIGSSEEVFEASMLSSYGVVDGIKYKSAVVIIDEATSQVFIECLVESKKSLYFFSDRYFILSNSTLTELKSERKEVVRGGSSYFTTIEHFKSVLANEMKDCNSIAVKIQSTKLSKSSLISLFTDYATCTDNGLKILSAKEKVLKANFGLSFSAFYNWAKIESRSSYYAGLEEKGNAPTGFAFSPTAFVEFNNTRSSNRIRLRVGISYVPYELKSLYRSTVFQTDNDFTIKSSRIELPIQARISAKRQKEGLYGVFGIGLNFVLSWSDTQIISSSNYQVEFSDLYPKAFFVNSKGGIGYNMPFEKHLGYLELIYDYSLPFETPYRSTPRGSLQSLSFSLGFIF